MATTSQYATDERGRIRLYVGYWSNTKDKRVQRPFHFGTDHADVPARLARVTELWAHIVKEWESLVIRSRRLGAEPERRDGKPIWSSTGIWIADQLAKGNLQIVVPRGVVEYPHWQTREPIQQPERETDYARRLRALAKDWPMVYFVAEDQSAAEQGAAHHQKAVELQLAQLDGDVPSNLLATKSESFHEALRAYIKSIGVENVEPTPDGPQLSTWGQVRMENAQRLKLHHQDCPLSTLDFDGCQQLIDYWRNRPIARSKGKANRPMAQSYCKHHVDELKRFFRWTSKSKQFNWRKPDDFDELVCGIRDIEQERTDISVITVESHSIAELTLLYEFGSDLERLLLLLGLNCGFRGSEAGSTREAHLFLNEPHPKETYLAQFGQFKPLPEDRFLCYSRRKTKVYGEWLLWPETVKAIRWALERKRRLGFSKLDWLLVTKEGQPFYRRTTGNKNVSQIFSNKWTKLNRKISRAHKDFCKRPFGSFRDTGSDFIRQLSDGEASSCYLMHGTPTKDDLIDLYSNRPFGKVHNALREMRTRLQPMFDAAPLAFSTPPIAE